MASPPKRRRLSTHSLETPTADAPESASCKVFVEEPGVRGLQDVSTMTSGKLESEVMDPPRKRSRAVQPEIDIRETPKIVSTAAVHVSGSSQGSIDEVSEEEDKSEPISRQDSAGGGLKVHPKGYITKPPPTGRAVRIYADGVFDLFHLGHMRQLEQAKKAFPEVYLLVGVTGDKETHRRKGLTVLSGKERAESVRHCRWVDEVIEDCPWVVSLEFMEEHKIDYVAHDDLPYGADEGDDIYAPIKAQGQFLVTQRTEGVSTTGIITKIVRDYEKYITRQLKRGTPRRELNISWLKKNEIDVKRHLAELRDNIRTNWTTTGQELGKDLWQFWQTSRPNSPTRRSLRQQLDMLPESSLSPTRSRADLDDTENDASAPLSNTSDFVTGYTLGLVGGIRSWMTRSRRTLNDDEAHSPDSSGPTELERNIA